MGHRSRTIHLCVLPMLALAACGGGSGGLNPIAPPPVSSTPTPTPTPGVAAVTIFPAPAVEDYASLGVWTNLGGAAGEWSSAGVPTTPSAAARISRIEVANQDQPNIRYTAGGSYEVRLPGEAYDRLIHDRRIANPSQGNSLLQLQTHPNRFLTLSSPRNGYRYSAMASWWRPDLDFAFAADFGVVAFGTPTSAGSVPTTGSATYSGVVAGITDAKSFDPVSNSHLLLPAGGTVTLMFDFGRGSLAGQMALQVNDGMNPIDVGTYAFRQTIFSPGSVTYSGSFETGLPGQNLFNGRFTGPAAQETIGNWAVPFTLDGSTHQAIGAWIAKTDP